MAQDFAKSFYRSKQWRKTRAAVLRDAHGICQRCGQPSTHMIVHHRIRLTPENIHDPEVTLNQDNLEAVCQDCHNAIDHDDLEHDQMLMFDEEGNFLPPQK